MPLTTLVAGNTITASGLNNNFAVCLLKDTAGTVSVTHTYSATQTFTGGFTTGAAVTLGGNLLFTDATYDIGASGATRPRDFFLSRNAVIGGIALIGTSTSYARENQALEVSVSGDYGGAALTTWTATAGEAPILDLNRSKSATPGTYTAVTTNDVLGYVAFRGADGGAFDDGAYISGVVTGAVASGKVPAKIQVYTTTTAGVTNLAATFGSDQSLTVVGSASVAGLQSTAGITVTVGTTSVQALTVASGQTLTLTGATVAGAPTWSSSQAITLSTAAQPNVTSVGTLASLTVDNHLTVNMGGLTVTSGTAAVQALTSTGATITNTSGPQLNIQYNGSHALQVTVGASAITIDSNDEIQFNGGTSLKVNSNAIGFFSTTSTGKKTVTGSRGGNAALASLLTQLAAYGLVTDSSS